MYAEPSGRAVLGLGPQPLASWDCGIESRWVMDFCFLWVLCVVR